MSSFYNHSVYSDIPRYRLPTRSALALEYLSRVKDAFYKRRGESRLLMRIGQKNQANASAVTIMACEIDATDVDVRYDLVEVLNLNCSSSPLVSERKAALDALIQELGTIPDEEFLPSCQAILNEFLAETTEKTPYVGILVWYLTDLCKM